MKNSKDIILTGDRATGQLHLGHFAGSLKQRVALQEQYNQTILIADMQGLTDNGHDPKKVSSNILNIVADYLAVGIDPLKTTICLQSAISALSELTMYYSNLVTVNRLKRNPTVRNEINNKSFEESVPVGFFTYPVSQAADITAFKATIIPVGEDQLPMIEQANEIVKKLNTIARSEILVESKALLSDVPRLPSANGKHKMSKSMGNCIVLDSSEKDIKKAVNSMFTDPGHLNIDDPGKVEGNVVFTYLDAFHPDKAFVESMKRHYQRGGLGDGQTKKVLNECLQDLLAPIRKRRQELIADQAYLIKVLKEGTEQANKVASSTLAEIKAAFGLSIF